MGEHGIKRRRPVFRGRVIDVALETVELPTGQEAELEIVRHPGGAAAVAIDNQERVCLLRQYRHAGDGWLWADARDPGVPTSSLLAKLVRAVDELLAEPEGDPGENPDPRSSA